MAAQYPAAEQHSGSCQHSGRDDDGSYFKLLHEVTHYPNDYDHGHSDTVNTLPSFRNSPTLSRLDIGPPSAHTGSPLLEPSLTLGPSLLDQDFLVERPSFTMGSSPLPPLKTLRNVYGPVLTTVAPEFSPEQQWFTNDQVRTHTSSNKPSYQRRLHSTHSCGVHFHHPSPIKAAKYIIIPTHKMVSLATTKTFQWKNNLFLRGLFHFHR